MNLPYKIIDNFLNKKEIEEIHQTIFSDNFAWYIASHQHTVSSYDLKENKDNNTLDYFQFCHILYFLKDNQTLVNSDCHYLADKIISRSNLTNKIIRAKVNLQTQNKDATLETYNCPHIDMDENHLAAIYYVNDSDGFTFLFDFDNNIVEKIIPKKGRLLLFEGKLKHASGHPVHSLKRCVINFNLTT